MMFARSCLRLRLCVAVVLAIWVFAIPVPLQAQDHSETLDSLMKKGQLDEAVAHFEGLVASSPEDSNARVALGLCQFFQAVEFLGQANHRHGTLSRFARDFPMVRLPVPPNDQPEKLSYDRLREILNEFQRRLATAEATLAAADPRNVKLVLDPASIRLDLDGNGESSQEESLAGIISAVSGRELPDEPAARRVAADGADVHWLRGYSHLLMALCDIVLAYDERELFERCGHLIFPAIETPWTVTQDAKVSDGSFETPILLDAIAAIHLMRFELVELGRMQAAHDHLMEMIAQSRQSWERARAETDDDREWLPNPSQTGVLGIPVEEETIDAWMAVLDEFESILQGESLIPFSRDIPFMLFGGMPDFPAQGRGINMRRFFHEPGDFDLVLALQGTGVEQYMETGNLTTPEEWERLTRVFQGQFFGFAVWFN